MLVSQAHSFVQQARLAITLAWVAGYTNILTILTCGTVTSHISGTTSNLGRDVAERSWGAAGFAVFLIASFFIGSFSAGFVTEYGRRQRWDSIYVLPIAIEMFLLGAFAVLVELGAVEAGTTGSIVFVATGLASLAMGLQNATITRISSGVVRTTHMTGVVTDLGIESALGAWRLFDRRRAVAAGLSARAFVFQVAANSVVRRIALLSSIVGSFALGAGLGTFAFVSIPRLSLLPPVLFLLWIVYIDATKPIAAIDESTIPDSNAESWLPPGLVVYHLRKHLNRKGKVHRLPDLDAWADRLPPGTRAAVLDVGDAVRIDAHAVHEFRAIVSRLRAAGCELIIAGLTTTSTSDLRGLIKGGGIKAANVCPDVELAIARAMALIENTPMRRSAK